MNTHRWKAIALTIVLFCPVSVALAGPPQPDPDVAYAERTLRAAGIETDGRSVLAFIRAQTLSETDLERLALAVRSLGADEFAEREKAGRILLAAGRSSLPYLRPALRDPDLEIARRARLCVEEIRSSPTPIRMIAAAQLVKDRRPPEAAVVLLAYLPCIDEEALEESWFDALRIVGLRDGRPEPILLAALSDKRSIRRALAAHVLGRSSSDEVRRRVVPLLTDSDPRVRFEAAASLVRFGEKTAVPVLTALLTDAPLSIAFQSESLLFSMADGQDRPTTALSNGEIVSRRQCRAGWETWWRKHADRVDLSRLQREEPLRGLTLVCEYDGAAGGGRVWEWGQARKLRWEIPGLEGPNDVQVLPGGRVLIAERNANRVTERDHQGKILWQHRASGNPIACQRLPNGNTLVATFNELYEVTIEQKKILTHSHRTGFRHAVKLPNGRVVFITGQGQIVELDVAWKHEVRSIRPANYASGASYWASVEPLPNGRYLLALGGANRVIEIDAFGKVQWECTVPSAVFATRLRNGHTLVSCFEGRSVVEVDRAGKEVNKQPLRGRPFVVRRY